jgi:N,N'-diacetyllegionaminate synthase
LNNKVTIIAEAGVNHNGDISIAKKLVDVAADAGADYVKFQTFKTENLVSKEAKKAAYQVENTGTHDSQFEMLKKLELSIEDHHELIEYCNLKNIKFFSTGFDIESIQFLKSLNLGLWKIPSGEITNLPYLQLIGSYNEPTILSTGMSNLDEIKAALHELKNAGLEQSKITVLHCTSDYPTMPQDVNIKAITTIKNTFDINIGYSDHTLGKNAAISSVALGSTLLEKHFTLDKNMDGPDHKASLEPNELKDYISTIREIETMMGNGEKKPTKREDEIKLVARKSIYIKGPKEKDSVIKKEDLVFMRPGDGISPMEMEKVIGKLLKHDIFENTKLEKVMIYEN